MNFLKELKEELPTVISVSIVFAAIRLLHGEDKIAALGTMLFLMFIEIVAVRKRLDSFLEPPHDEE